MMFSDCVIMAGGSGARLWPASGNGRPKQFMPLPGHKEKTFFHAALDRAVAVTNGDDARIIVVAGRAHVPYIKEICAGYPKGRLRRITLIPEPKAKNTAAAVACAAVFAERSPGAALPDGAPRCMLVLTSDHIIEPEADFAKQARALAPLVRQGGLAVFGIPPRYPETGYGYIETAGSARDGVFAVASFREKPDRVSAEKYLQAGNFFWNSGMFAFRTDFILNEFRENAAGVLSPFEKLAAPVPDRNRDGSGLNVLENWQGLDAAYDKTEQVPFDIAVVEKCRNVIMAKAAFDWHDAGSWDEYVSLLPIRDENVFSVGSSSCFVDSPVPVGLCGVDDLIVIVRNSENGELSGVLVAKKGETQRVKEIAGLIEAGNGKKAKQPTDF
ncbi:MAG: NTP transferase domain-containing protein [Spirochaetaceae bacterium]|nr:NTP transferase domain-containing protein [Spirochaetaceae bacterium]